MVVGDAASGGPMIWLKDGKVIAASSTSSEINKDVSNDPLVLAIIAALKVNKEDEKVVVSYDNGKKTAVAWGRKALMGGKVDDKMPKFFCYVTFDNPGT